MKRVEREGVFRKYDGQRQYLGIKKVFTTCYSEFLFIRTHCSKLVKNFGYAYRDEVGFLCNWIVKQQWGEGGGGWFTTLNANTLTEISKKRRGTNRPTALKLDLSEAYDKLSWNLSSLAKNEIQPSVDTYNNAMCQDI